MWFSTTPNIHPDGTLCILSCFREKLEQKSCSTYIQTGLWETKKTTQHKQEKHRILPLFVNWKMWAFYWAQCHWQRSEKHPSYAWSWRSLVVCCQSSRRQAVNEDGSGEDVEMREKSCSLPFLPKWNTTDRLSKKPLTRIKQTGKLFRAARCEACSSTQLEAIKVHVGHCHNCPVKTFVLFSRHTQRRPLQTLGMIILFFFFNPLLWPEVCSLKVGVMHTKTLQKSPSTRLTAPDSEKKPP